jgi:RHS repeat-associated protein
MVPSQFFPRLILVASLVLLVGSHTSAQSVPQTGTPPFGTFNRDAIDIVNVGNLNVLFQFPLFAKKGRGLDFSAQLRSDNLALQPFNANESIITPTFWQTTVTPWHVSLSFGAGVTYTTRQSHPNSDPPCNNGNNYIQYYIYENFVYFDSSNTAHPFYNATVGYPTPCYPTQSFLAYSPDGYLLSFSIDPTSGAILTDTITDLSGNIQNLLGGAGITDPNGNTIGAGSVGTVNDTTGNTVMSSPAGTLTSRTSYFPNPAGGLTEATTFTSSTFTIQTNFKCPNVTDITVQGVYLTTGISLPDQTSYSIVYESTNGAYPSSVVTGRIHSLTLPSGATITFTYSGGTNGINCQDGSPAILTKQTPDGTWTYTHYFTPTVSFNGSWINGLWTTIVTDPAGNDTVYTFGSTPIGNVPSTATLEDQRLIYQGSHTAGTLLKTIVSCYNGNFTNCTTALNQVANAPIAVTRKDVYTYLPGLSPSLSETFYSPTFALVTQDNEFDFGVNTGAAPTTAPLKATMITYANPGNNIVNRPACIQVTSGTSPQTCGTVTSTTQSITNYLNYDSHGNVGTIQQWVSGSTYVSKSFTYLSNGLVNTATDFKQTPTQYTYGACNGSYPTQITTAGLSQYYTWDCNGGVVTSTTDANSRATHYSFSNPSTGVGDPFWRLIQVTYPDGGQTTTTYNDTASPANVSTSQLIDSSGHAITTQTIFDALGRHTQSAVTSDPDGTTYRVVGYDTLGRTYRTYNPTRCNPPTTNCAESTWGYSTTQYDALNRVTSVTEQDGSIVSISYTGNCTTVTDESQKARKSCSDALGRLSQVFEDPGSSPHLNYETDYAYDALGNLLTVNQKGGSTNAAYWRTRTFAYDGLSRLTSSINPESNTVPATGATIATTYIYDANGNLTSKTSPAPNQTGTGTVTLSYCYDALNRLTSKAYTAQSCPMSSPIATYLYDQSSYNGLTITNGIGRRTGMTDPAGSEAWSYDPMGRPLTDRRVTNAITKNTSYAYLPYLDGSINTLTYPSGRTLTYSTGGAEWPLSVQDNSTNVYYAASAHYTPSGALSSIASGSSITSAFFYNPRLQPCRVSVESTGAAPASCTDTANFGNILDYAYNFSLGASDNGNVTAIANNRDNTRSQNFSYDSLNRISTAQTQTTGVTIPNPNCWGLTFGYDPWGNLQTSSTTGPAGCSEPLPLNISVGTSNRVTSNTVAGQTSNYCYDSAGNLIFITASGASCPTSGPYQYVYDAENHLTSAGSVTYTYDGEGKRVQKSNGKIYWYGMNSDPLIETDLAGNNLNEYVFFGGERIAMLGQAALPVQNGNFENWDQLGFSCGTGCWYNDQSIPNWTFSGSGGGGLQQLNTTYYNQETSIMAWLYSGQISQTLSGISLQPNTTYTLSVGVGHRLDGYVTNYSISLQAGSTVLATYSGSNGSIPAGTIATETVTYSTGSSVPSGNLTIVLSAAGSQGDFDNVQLNVNGAFYYAKDFLGTARVVTDSSGHILDDSDFYPFGGERDAITPTSGNNYKFTGKERDQESGLDNFGARYSSSNLGRFMSPDEFWKDSHVGDPQSWNKYAYARNNPLRYTDPNGGVATETITCTIDDQSHKTCDVNISATIAIFAAPGSDLTSDQLNAAKDTIKSSIEGAWSGTVEEDDVTYNVSTQVSVQVASSQNAAMSTGAQNVIGLTNGPPDAAHDTGAYVDPRGAVAAITGKGPDTGLWDFNNLDNYAKHEFTHLLGTDNKEGVVLSNGSPAMRPDHATAQDLKWGIREAIDAVHSNTAHPWRMVIGNYSFPLISHFSATTTVQAGWHWWK